MRRIGLMGVLAIVAALPACAPLYEFSVLYESPGLDLTSIPEATILVVPPREGPDITRLLVKLIDPRRVVAEIETRVHDAMTGEFICNHVWQCEMRTWLRGHIEYAESEDRNSFSSCVEFADVGHGVLDARLTDAASLENLSASLGCDYVLFLEGLLVGGQAELVSLPGVDSGGHLTPYYFMMESTVASVQYFLVSSSPPEVLYHGYVKSDASKPFYDCWLNMTRQLVRGALGVR